MKTVLMIFTCLALTAVSSASDYVKVSADHTSKLYQSAHMYNHIGPVEDYFGQELSEYGCVPSKLEVEVIKEMESFWFKKSIPGKVVFSYSSVCETSKDFSFKFLFNPAGYDEDYSEVILEAYVDGELDKRSRTCLYATRTSYVKCHWDDDLEAL